MDIKPDYRGELAIALRAKMGFTQKRMAEYFGMSLGAWQQKEQNKNRVSVAEYHLILLLLNQHPEYVLLNRLPEVKSTIHKAALTAFELSQYLSAGDTSEIILPSRVEDFTAKLQKHTDSIRFEWENGFNKVSEDKL